MAYCKIHDLSYLTEHGCYLCLRASSRSPVALVSLGDRLVSLCDVLASERDALRAFLRELTGDGGPLGIHTYAQGSRRFCRACKRTWNVGEPEAHENDCLRQRALALGEGSK